MPELSNNSNIEYNKTKIIEKKKNLKLVLKRSAECINLETPAKKKHLDLNKSIMESPHIKELNHFNSLNSKQLLAQIHNLFATGVSMTTIAQSKVDFERIVQLKNQQIGFHQISHEKEKIWFKKEKLWQIKQDALLVKIQNSGKVFTKTKQASIEDKIKLTLLTKNNQELKNRLHEREKNLTELLQSTIGTETKSGFLEKQVKELKISNKKLKNQLEEALLSKHVIEKEKENEKNSSWEKDKEIATKKEKYQKLVNEHDQLQKVHAELCQSVENFSMSFSTVTKRRLSIVQPANKGNKGNG